MLVAQIISLVCIGLAAAVEIDFGQQILYDDIKWAFFPSDGTNVTMECQDSNLNISLETDYEIEWKSLTTPDDSPYMVLEDIENRASKYMYSGADGIDKVFLTVMNVSPDDYSSRFLCTVRNNSGEVMFQLHKSINYRHGPLYSDLTLKYRTNIITGVVAAAVALVLILGFWVLYRLRFSGANSSKSYSLNGNYYPEEKTRNAYDNPGMQTEKNSGHMEMEEHTSNDNGGVTNSGFI